MLDLIKLEKDLDSGMKLTKSKAKRILHQVSKLHFDKRDMPKKLTPNMIVVLDAQCNTRAKIKNAVINR